MRRLLPALLLVGLTAGAARAESEPIQVLAAITLGPALDAIATAYGQAGGGPVRPVYGPTPALVRQVENGLTVGYAVP